MTLVHVAVGSAHTSDAISSWETTRFGFRTRNASRSNCRGLRESGRPARLADRETRLTSMHSNRSVPLVFGIVRMHRTLAACARGGHGRGASWGGHNLFLPEATRRDLHIPTIMSSLWRRQDGVQWGLLHIQQWMKLVGCPWLRDNGVASRPGVTSRTGSAQWHNIGHPYRDKPPVGLLHGHV